MLRALIACVALAVVLAVPAGATAAEPRHLIFDAPRELLGADAGLRAQTLDELQGMGVGWVRVVLYWRAVAPNPDSAAVPGFNERRPDDYPAGAWDRYDRVIREARARGMRILLTASGPVPRWATRDRRDNVSRPIPSRFYRFMLALGRRYGDQVDHWAVWNEPNHPKFLAPQRGRGRRARDRYPAAWLYRRLVQAASHGLRRAGQGSDTILMGETAPRGTGSVTAPITFLRVAGCLDSRWRKARRCGRLPADGYAHHPYTTRAGPWFVPPSRNDVTIGVLHRLNRALYRAGRARAVRRAMPIWITEFGIQSRPDPFVGVSQTAQAEYRSIGERMAWRNRRVRAFAQYLMRDDDPREGVPRSRRWSGFESGLREADGDPKRAYDGFRLPLVAKRVGRRRVRTYLWGLVRPASGPTTVLIEFKGRGGRRWHRLKRDRTDARGVWETRTRHVGGRRYRVVWTDAAGRRHAGPPTRVYRR